MPDPTTKLPVEFRDPSETAGGRIPKDQALAWLREKAPKDLDLSNPSKLDWVLGYGAKISTRWRHSGSSKLPGKHEVLGQTSAYSPLPRCHN